MALDEAARAGLVAIAGAENVHADPLSLLSYARDAGLERGRPEVVALPGDAGQVSALVAWANAHGLPVTGWGAGTGQTGGAVAARGGLVISFARLHRILDLDAEASQAVVEPGLITGDLDRAARDEGLTYPPDPASGSASSLGGNIAENAGGPRCCKYGVTSHYVLGLDTVLADGRTVTWGGPVFDPPEPNFLDVVIGSEGTLALVTRARLRLAPLPEAAGTMLASFRTPEDAAAAVSAVIRSGLRPAALEMLDGLLFNAVERSAGMNLTPGAGALLIADVEGYAAGLAAKVGRLEAIVRPFDPLEIRLATSEAARAAIWYARKSAFAATAWIAPNDCSMDVVVPRSQLPAAFRAISVLGQAAGFRIGYLSHAGDGNIHPEIFCDLAQPGVPARVTALQDEIIHYVIGLGGSISGEHGIGLEKRRHLALMYGPAELATMMDVKAVFDPAGRLNPGKIFPEPPSLGYPLKREIEGDPPPLRYPMKREIEGDPAPAGVAGVPAAPDAVAGRDAPASAPSLRPASAAELAALLADLQDRRQPAWLGGAGTKCAPGADANVAAISTAGLGGILTRSYDDFYVTVGAGATVAEVAAALAADGYLFPLAAPWPAATVGGTVAAQFNAPWRGLYGGIRELLLAADVVLPDGRRLRLGRPLVKDVAGYSLHKLWIGAFGGLAALTALSLRIYPQPPVRRSRAVACPDLTTALAVARILGRPPGLVSALLLLSGSAAAAGLSPAPYQVIGTLDGAAEDVAIAGDQIGRDLAAARLPAAHDLATATAGQSADPELPAGGVSLWAAALRSAPWLLRAGVPPAGLPALLAAVEAAARRAVGPATFVADLAHNLLYLPGAGPAAAVPPWESALRGQAESAGGYALALGAGVYPPRGLRVSPTARDLLAGLKRRWDPGGILNPGVLG